MASVHIRNTIRSEDYSSSWSVSHFCSFIHLINHGFNIVVWWWTRNWISDWNNVFSISSDYSEYFLRRGNIWTSSLVCIEERKKPMFDFILLNRMKINDDENERSISNERSMKVHKKSVRAIGLTPDGQSIITVSKDKSIKIRSTETGKMIHKYKRAHE